MSLPPYTSTSWNSSSAKKQQLRLRLLLRLLLLLLLRLVALLVLLFNPVALVPQLLIKPQPALQLPPRPRQQAAMLRQAQGVLAVLLAVLAKLPPAAWQLLSVQQL
jgi:hypothetical protein